MIATISGRPSNPARAKDSGVPPTPTQIGSGSCTGRGKTRWRTRAGRCRPDQVTSVESRIRSSSSSFSVNSES